MYRKAEERQRMDRIYQAFQSYIRSQDYFDMVYSEKVGYVEILVSDPTDLVAVRFETADALLHELVERVIGNVVFASDNVERLTGTDALKLSRREELKVRRCLMKILEPLEKGQNHYLQLMDQHIKRHQKLSSN